MNTRHRNVLILLILACFSIAGVIAAPQEARSGKTPDYYPLAAGSAWNYTCMESNEMVTYRVTGAFKIKDRDTIRVEGKNKDGVPLAADYYVKTKDSVLIVASDNLAARKTVVYKEPSIALPIPMTPGKTWTTVRLTSNGGTVSEERKVEGQQKVTTPAGEFQCIHVSSNANISGKPATIDRWYAPGIGLIRWQVNQSGQKATFHLTQYIGGKK